MENNEILVTEHHVATKTKKGESTTAIAVKRLKDKQLNLVFNSFNYDELRRIKKAVDSALNSKKEEEKQALLKKIELLDAE